MSQPAPVHARLGRLAELVGTWEGDGQGLWTAAEPFRYHELATISSDGRPFLAYRQRSTALADGAPRHGEAGWFRPGAEDGRAELVLAQPTGIVEVHRGRWEGDTLVLRATLVGRAETALSVTGVERRLHVEGDRLTYLLRIAMNDEELADHLAAELHRVTEASDIA